MTGDVISTTLEITRYIDFVTNLILLFGPAFEFPLIVLMLNFAGSSASAKLLGWWRVVVFLFVRCSPRSPPRRPTRSA